MGDVVNLGRRDLTTADTLQRRGAAIDDGPDFREFFESSYPRLVRTIWFVVHDHGLSEDIAQEAFIELHRQWRKVRSYDRPDLWVRKVALRRARREAAHAVRRIGAEQQSAHPDSIDDALPDPALRAAIATLPAMQRAMVALFYLEDRPMAEVADLLGCSTATGFVHLHRARTRLAELLSETVPQEVDGHVD